MNPRPWPENTYPTAQQWLDWVLTLDRTDQLAQAEQAMRNAADAQLCILANHHGLLDEVRHLRQFAANEYQRGVEDFAEAFTQGMGDDAA